MKFKIALEFFVIVKLGVRVSRSPAERWPNGLNGNGVEQPRFQHPDQPGVQIKAGVGGGQLAGGLLLHIQTERTWPLPQLEYMHYIAHMQLGTSGSQSLGNG